MDAAWVAAWAAVATAFIYIVLGVFAFRQVAEAKRLRLEQTRPYVIVDFALERSLIYLEVKNIGKTSAGNLSITFDQALRTTLAHNDLTQAALLARPVAMLAPGRSIRVLFDVATNRLGRDDLPLAYEVTCQYEDMHGRRYNDPAAILDLSPHMGTEMSPKALPDLIAEVERIRKEFARWTDGSRGLLVQAVNRDVRVRRRDRWHWRQTARLVREREGWWAYGQWLIKRQLERYGWTR